MQKWLCCAALVMVMFNAHGQQLTGTIADAVDGEPLVGANVVLDGGTLYAVTDEKGKYLFDQVEPGRHTLQVTFLGYKTGVLHDVWVKNGKVTTEGITLNRDFTSLDEIIISEPVRLSEMGKLTITEEQINRFAATYYDPARLITISPDVAVSNDQNNQISVRGISPNYNTWRLEGVEIVNPNHLSNAGTFSDQPASTGGGVNMLSAQMLDNSSFLYSGFSADYGNSIGGLFDMELKKGNEKERQYTAQASLIGLDFSAEGPFSKDSKVSYIANYRYSFTGLLTSMGVDFGGESIGFQDLSLKVNVPLSDKGNLSFFGVGGLNFNNFDARTFEESEVQKDRSDIYYNGKVGVVGAHLDYQVPGGVLDLSMALSSSSNSRDQATYDQDQNQVSSFDTEQTNSIFSFNARYKLGLSHGFATVGFLGSNYAYDFQASQSGGDPFDLSHVYGRFYFDPYVDFMYPFGGFLKLNLGINYNLNDSGDQSVDPRMTLTFFTGDRSEVYLSAGSYSQLLNPANYYFVFLGAGGDYYETDGNYNFIRSHRFLMGFNQHWTDWQLSVEGFYYQFPEVNIGPVLSTVESPQEATSYGVSATVNRTFTSNWYFNMGGSVFQSTWGEDFSNRYNLKSNLNASVGKEWFFNNKPIKRSLGLNARVIYQGGLMDPLVESQLFASNVTTLNGDYARVDLRIQWTRYHENRTSSIALDMQNATNRRNDAYQYYDAFTGQIENQTQLGLIPILTYRVEF